MKTPIRVLFMLSFLEVTIICKPLNMLDKTSKALSFMKKFGYVQSDDAESAALYTENGLSSAIKDVQRYGGIPETGKLDNATLALMSSRRCGLPDKDPKTRKRRFVLGTKAWVKSRLTYFVANHPYSISNERINRDVQKALDAWAGYGRLEFHRAHDANADIIISFSRGYHGDYVPFDGPGGILAHAYLPQQGGHLAGDVHFDADETWTEELQEEGTHFYTVALHELGHSLGLLHSDQQTSIMSPYYKGDIPQLGYDDVLGMYELYIKDGGRRKESEEEDHEDDEEEQEEETDNNGGEDNEIPFQPTQATPLPTPETKEPRWFTTTTQLPSTFDGDFESVETHKNHDRKHGVAPKMPDICQGSFDAAATLRNELFIFKDKFVWRYKEKNELIPGYPIPFKQLFPAMPNVDRIDAAYERPDGNIVLFIGNQFWVYDGSNTIEGSPLPLTYYGLPHELDKVDAVQLWARNGKTYLYRADRFWRYNEATKTVDEGYPKGMERWTGVPTYLDAAVTWKDNITYFFKGKQYWKFDNDWVKITESSPMPTPQIWFGCPKEEDIYP